MTLYSCVRPHIIDREQLGKVLTLVSVSGQEEGEAQLLLRRLQAVEEEVRGGEEKKEERLAREEEKLRLAGEEEKLKSAMEMEGTKSGNLEREETAEIKMKEKVMTASYQEEGEGDLGECAPCFKGWVHFCPEDIFAC